MAAVNAVSATAQTIRGTVVDQTTGDPVWVASVMLLDEEGILLKGTVIDETGRFTLELPGAGIYTVRTDAAGYATFVTSLDVGTNERMNLQIRLDPVTVLDTLTISGTSVRRDASLFGGFYDRQERGLGGLYFTKEQIEQRGPSQITDLLRTAPGVRVVPMAGGPSGVTHYTVRMLGASFQGAETDIFNSRNPIGLSLSDTTPDVRVSLGQQSCIPILWLDGVRLGPIDEASGVGIDGVVSPDVVEGIEVYRGLGEIPAEFASANARCGVLVVWTKRAVRRAAAETGREEPSLSAEAARALEQLRKAQRAQQQEAAHPAGERAADVRARAQVERGAGEVEVGTSPLDSARALFMAAQRASDRRGEASLREAIALWSQAADAFGRLDREAMLGLTLQRIGLAYHVLEQPDSAEQYQRYAERVVEGRSTPWRTVHFVAPDGWGVQLSGEFVSHNGTGTSHIAPTGGVTLEIRHTTGNIQVGVGLQHSVHSLGNIPEQYGLLGLFAEPRYVLRGFSDRIAPFFGARGGLFFERVAKSGANFKASGLGIGGTAGIIYQLSSQVGLEIGAAFDKQWFSDFTFKGEAVWLSCLAEQRELQSPMPEAVRACSSVANRPGIPQIDVDRTFFYPGSGRSTTRLRLFTGFALTFGTRR